ncbi:serine hydrolase domain-containing protein [Actinopolymorpha alba]|uniref:serine hydrolase domain-containing protein n=1 Tax=Actinopolymorpha alba TaxID=533267 RepID=UPI00035D5A54|nr:serine hydrolase domain-containing protein [Actinopolymorpha alba]
MRFYRKPLRTMVAAGVVLLAFVAPAAAQASGPERLDAAKLQAALDGVHRAGIHGAISRLDQGHGTWRGASGVADLVTSRPVRPHFQHRIGSVTKAFTAVAVLQQVGLGGIDLDAPIGRYLPDLVPGERGQRVTVRMLLEHTSGIGNYIAPLFPSMPDSLASVDAYRFRSLSARDLALTGLAEPPTGEPGAAEAYSNTNYVLAGLILERVTGQPAQEYITRNVIERAGLRATYFPGNDPSMRGPHSKAYLTLASGESGEYSIYNMTWGGTAGALVSTADDLAGFARALLGGRLLPPEQLAEMKARTVTIDPIDLAGCQTWMTAGTVMGMETVVLASDDGRRVLVYEANTTDQRPERAEAIQAALLTFIRTAGEQGLCH